MKSLNQNLYSIFYFHWKPQGKFLFHLFEKWLPEKFSNSNSFLCASFDLMDILKDAASTILQFGKSLKFSKKYHFFRMQTFFAEFFRELYRKKILHYCVSVFFISGLNQCPNKKKTFNSKLDSVQIRLSNEND